MSENPLVSIVITTKNEEKNVPNVMKSIQNQTYKNIETILVDNGSEDKTKEIAKQYTGLVFDKGPERSAQRNHGMITKSHGKYVMFIDCDMVLSPNLVKESVVKLEQSNYVALHIPEVVLGKGYWSKVRRFERSFYNGTVIDGARFFLKETFKSAGGFDETMSGPEDWDIDKKMKQRGKIGLLKANEDTAKWKMLEFIKLKGVNPRQYGVSIYHNEADFDLKKYLNKKGYYATSFDAYIQKWGKSDPDLKKQLGLGYRFFGVFLEQGRWLRLLRHPFLTWGMLYLRFAVGIQYLNRKSQTKAAANPYQTKSKS